MKAAKHKRARAVAAAVSAPPRQPELPAWSYFAALFAAFIGLFIVYSPALHGPFLLDDTYLPYLLPNYSHELAAWINGVRPLLMFSYWLNFTESGNQDAFPYHLVNVLLHLANSVFSYLAVRKVLRWANTEKLHAEILAIFAGGLFLLHPLQTESVSYVASRSETLSVFFVLAAYVTFLYRRRARASVAVSAAVLLLYAAAGLAKEHAVALAALLLLTDYYWNPGFSLEGIRGNWKLYVPALAAGSAGLFFVWRVLGGATTAGFRIKDLPWYDYFFTECRAIWVYVRLFVFPVGQNVDPEFPISHGIFDRGAMVGLFALIVAVALAWIYRKRFPVISYGVFAFLLLIAPTSSVVPIQDPLAERRMYLPFIGLLFVAAGLLRRWKNSHTTLVATLSIALAVAGWLSYQRNLLWADGVALWSDSASKSPRKVRPNFQLAYAYYQTGACDRAVEQFAKTAQLQPPDYSLLVDWALAYDCAGSPGQAVAKLQQAAALEQSAHVYSQIGMEYAKQSKFAEALAALDKAAALDPRFEITYSYRGNVYSMMGNAPKAIEDYRRALEINPEDQTARQGLARLGK